MMIKEQYGVEFAGADKLIDIAAEAKVFTL